MSEEDEKEFVEEWDKQHTHTHGKGVPCHACTGSDDDKKSMCLIYWLESRRTLRKKIDKQLEEDGWENRKEWEKEGKNGREGEGD